MGKPFYLSDATLDEISYAMQVIGFEHAEVHEGNAYKADLNTSDLDSNKLTISFKTPSTTGLYIHLVILASTTGEAALQIVEGCTVAGGTDLTIFNRNRVSSNTSAVISTGSTTVNKTTQGGTISNGTQLHHELFGSGKNKIAGENRDILEWVLASDTIYAVELSSSTNQIVGQLSLRWYEHINE